jgi:hypothetical protein
MPGHLPNISVLICARLTRAAALHELADLLMGHSAIVDKRPTRKGATSLSCR